MVGQAIGGKLRELGHDVRTGSRQAKDSFVTFADAAKHGENVRSDARATPIASRPHSMGSTSTMGRARHLEAPERSLTRDAVRYRSEREDAGLSPRSGSVAGGHRSPGPVPRGTGPAPGVRDRGGRGYPDARTGGPQASRSPFVRIVRPGLAARLLAKVAANPGGRLSCSWPSRPRRRGWGSAEYAETTPMDRKSPTANVSVAPCCRTSRAVSAITQKTPVFGLGSSAP